MPYRTLGVKDGKEVIREYAPTRRTIKIGNGTVFSLQMPYIIFFKRWNGLHVAFSGKPIKSKKDIVYCATLGNIYPPVWHICGCDGYEFEKAIQVFWGTKFTTDGMVGSRARRQAFGSYHDWEKIKELKTVLKKLKDIENTKTFGEFVGSDECKLTLKSKYPKSISIKTLEKKPPKEDEDEDKEEDDYYDGEDYDDYDDDYDDGYDEW